MKIENEHKLFHDLLNERLIETKSLNDIKTLEFSDSLKRLCTLVREKILTSPEAKLINEEKDLFKQLNYLRNRIWHRGKMVLHYNALDELFGRYLLPILPQLVSAYGNITESMWKYSSLHCKLDPINELIHEWEITNNTPDPDIKSKKTALLKEMARASYLIPNKVKKIEITNSPDQVIPLKNIPSAKENVKKYLERKREATMRLEEKKADVIHNSEIDERSFDIKICPVCGIHSLLRFADIVDGENNEVPCSIHIVYQAECNCCGFNIEVGVGNPSDYGYSDIPEIFEANSI